VDVPHFVSTPAKTPRRAACATPKETAVDDTGSEYEDQLIDSDEEDEDELLDSEPPSPKPAAKKASRQSPAKPATDATDAMPQFLRWVEKMVVRKDFHKALQLKEASVQQKDRELELKARELDLQEQELSKELEKIKLAQGRVRLEHQQSEEETAKTKLLIEQGKTPEIKLIEAKTALALAQQGA